MQEPDLQTLIARLEARTKKRQAATALAAGSAVLGLFVLIAPFFYGRGETVAVAEPQIQPVVANADAYQRLPLTAKAAIVYDLATGEILFQKNAQAQLPLASLTKLLTMYAAADTLGKDSIVTITDSALSEEGESGFLPGERFAFNDLARLALVASSNDAAEAIAEASENRRAVSGRSLLASVASAVGLSQTYALNGTGLDESASVAGGYGSAEDIARLAGAFIEKAPELASATIEPSMTIRSLDGVVHTLPSTNPGIVHVPNPLLSKTGFTDLAGGNLAIVYDAGIGHEVAIVVLGSTRESRFTDVDALLDRTMRYFAGTKP